jgi:hypothetical protein
VVVVDGGGRADAPAFDLPGETALEVPRGHAERALADGATVTLRV